MTKEEILEQYFPSPYWGKSIPSNALEAMQEYADQETASLRKELEEANKRIAQVNWIDMEAFTNIEDTLQNERAKSAKLVEALKDYTSSFGFTTEIKSTYYGNLLCKSLAEYEGKEL